MRLALATKRLKLANRFVCRALLDVAEHDLVSAGWRRLHAAWACDDADLGEEARVQRRAALKMLERARVAGQCAVKSVAGGDELLLADVARRAGEFGRAERHVAAGLSLMDRYPWVRLHPVYVHPDFVERVRAAVEQRLTNVDERSAERARGSWEWRLEEMLEGRK